TVTNALDETTVYYYFDDPNVPYNYGKPSLELISIEDPSAGGGVRDVYPWTGWTYDNKGRVRTITDYSDGNSQYFLTYEYDDLDRLTKVVFHDSTAIQFNYSDATRPLDPTSVQDRAGRQTLFEYNSARQVTKRTDPLGQSTYYQWCKCGALQALTDPMGRTT